MRLIFIIWIAALNVGSEPANLQIDRLSRLGAHAKRLFALFGLVQKGEGRIERHFVRRCVFGQRSGAFALLHKRRARLDREPRWVGFDAPSEFLVGYGLDYSEDLRHLPYIASL